jgi:branched-chain amino acid transport system ATP-binding protein
MTAAVLEAEGLVAGYHGHPFVHDVDLHVNPGEVVGLIGPNGAGKTTTLLAISGDITPLGGTVRFDGNVRADPMYARARDGLGFVTEERSVFMSLTTAENLAVGRADAERALAIFPELKPLMGRPAGLLSGGEQQMVTLARALVRRPKALLIDELSLGLAPLAVQRLLTAVRAAASDDGVGILLVEQKIEAALAVSDRVYVMRDGHIALSGTSSEVSDRVMDLEESYLASRPASSAVPPATHRPE